MPGSELAYLERIGLEAVHGPNPIGRYSKLDRALATKLVQLVQAGNYVQVACAACGITEETFYRWMREARALIKEHGDDPDKWPDDLPELHVRCALLHEALKVAQAEAEAYAVAIIRKHMPDQWTAAMAYLERRYPQRWKRRDVHEVVQGQGDSDGAVDEQRLLEDPEAARLMHEALQAAARGQLPRVVEAEVVSDDEE